MKYFLLLTCTFAFLLLPFNFAYAIRPLYTEDCWVTTFGKFAIESGGLLLTKRDNTGIKEWITSLKFGLSPVVDLSIDLPYMSHYSPEGNYDGMSTGTFKLKYNFWGDMVSEGACVLLGYQVNTADQTISSDPNAHDITGMLIYSKDLGAFSYHLNFGYMVDDEPFGQPHEDFILYNASLIKPVTDIINIMGEMQYSKNVYTGDIIGETAIGMNYKYIDRLIFDAAIGCGLNENSSSSNFVAGITWILN